MAVPAWKRLVRELTDQGFDSPYLERLRSRLNLEQSHRELEKEILQEMASALGRTEDKLNVALLELHVLERELEGLPPAAETPRRERVEAYNVQRQVACECLWELTIHREALGMRCHEVLARLYPIPPKRHPGSG